MVKSIPAVGMQVRLCGTWNPSRAPVGSTGVVEQMLNKDGYAYGFYVMWDDHLVQVYAGSCECFWFTPSDWRDFFEITGDGPW